MYQFTYVLQVSGFLLAHLQRQVYNFVVFESPGYGVSHPDLSADAIPRRLNQTEVIHLPLKMG
jgi:hypothetical protein